MTTPIKTVEDVVKAVFEEEVAAEVWYCSRDHENQLERLMVKSETRLIAELTALLSGIRDEIAAGKEEASPIDDEDSPFRRTYNAAKDADIAIVNKCI